MSSALLTSGAIREIVKNDQQKPGVVVQIIDMKPPKDGKCRVAISDGTSWVPGSTATNLSKQIESQEIKRYTLIKLNQYVRAIQANGRLNVTILSADVVDSSCQSLIGTPAPISLDGNSIPASQQKQQASASSQQKAPQAAPQSTYVPPPPPQAYAAPPPPPTYVPPPPPPAYAPQPQPAYNPQAQPLYAPPQQPAYVPPPAVYAQTPNPATPPFNQPPVQAIPATKDKRLIMALNSLHPYGGSNWTIQVRAVTKPQVREFNSRTGPSKLFSCNFKDSNGDEIKVTAFRDQVDRLVPLIEMGKVYYISGGQIKDANRNFNNTNLDVELICDQNTQIIEAPDDHQIGSLTYNYVPLSSVQTMPANHQCDILGIAIVIDPITSITTKKNKTMKKRRLEICDQSNVTIELTLWEEAAEAFPDSGNPIVSIKDARVGEFRGKSLSASSTSTILIDPQIPQAASLRSWFSSIEGNTEKLTNLSGGSSDFNTPYIYLQAIDERGLGVNNEKGDYFLVNAIFMDVMPSRHLYYAACPNAECKGKGLSTQDQINYHCDRCGRQTDKPLYRFSFMIKIGDFTGSAVAGVIGDENMGKMFTGMEINELVAKSTLEADDNKLRTEISKGYFKPFKLKIRAKTDSFNNEARVKLSLFSASPMNFAEGAKFYAAEIMKF